MSLHVCLHSHMNKTTSFLVGVLILVSAPANAFAQSSGSLGSSGNDTAPVLPVEHGPNARELETMAMINEVLDDVLDSFPEGEDYTVVLERDTELSRLAQLGAELTLSKFVTFTEEGHAGPNNDREFSPDILWYHVPYLESFVCGPAPLTLNKIEDAYRQGNLGGERLGDGLQYETYGVLAYEKPIGGVGYAESQGFACSYLLQQSANYPFR